MRLLRFLSPTFYWTVILLLAIEIVLRSSITLQCWLTRHNTPGVLTPYLFNTFEVKRQGKAIKVLILGDSVPMMAVDANQLALELGMQPETVFNFSHGGAGPASHLHNFKKLRQYLPNVRSILLFVQYKRLNQALAQAQTMAEDLLSSEEHPCWRAWQIASLTPIIQSYSLTFQLAPLIIWQGSTQPLPGLRPKPGGGTIMEDILPGPPVLPPQDVWEPNQRAIQDLLNLLLLCKEAGIKVRHYHVPYYPHFHQEWQGSDEYSAGRSLFFQLEEAGLIECHPDAFLGLETKLEPYYIDLWHLTPTGARIFTEALAQHLRQHPLPGIGDQ